MDLTLTTWREWTDRLTPEQIAHQERCDANATHSAGPMRTATG